MLPSNIARKPKITSGPSFFKGADVGVIVDNITVMAALSIQKQRRIKACGRTTAS